MIKWVIAVVLILAMLSVAGCCCCSSGYDGYSYSTVGGLDEANSGCDCGQCATPYDCLNGASDGSCACQK
jgi:hypothetical protein